MHQPHEHQDADRPAPGRADLAEAEPVEGEGRDADRAIAASQLQQAHRPRARATYSTSRERCGHHVEDVPRPGLLHEPGRDGDLALEQDVEQHDPGQEVGRGRLARVVLLRDEGPERAEQDHVEHRPERDVEPPVRAAEQHVAMPAHDGAHPQPRERRPVRQRALTAAQSATEPPGGGAERAACVAGERRRCGHCSPPVRATEPPGGGAAVAVAEAACVAGERRTARRRRSRHLVLGHDRARQVEEHAFEVAVPEGVRRRR